MGRIASLIKVEFTLHDEVFSVNWFHTFFWLYQDEAIHTLSHVNSRGWHGPTMIEVKTWFHSSKYKGCLCSWHSFRSSHATIFTSHSMEVDGMRHTFCRWIFQMNFYFIPLTNANKRTWCCAIEGPVLVIYAWCYCFYSFCHF